MNPLYDFITGILLYCETKTIFGLTFGYVAGLILLGSMLLLLVLCGAVLAKRLLCPLVHKRVLYPGIPVDDRRWYELADRVLVRAECVAGPRARTLARMTPGIDLDEHGIFRSLGPVPFEGLIALAQRLASSCTRDALRPLAADPRTRSFARFMK